MITMYNEYLVEQRDRLMEGITQEDEICDNARNLQRETLT